MTIERLEPLTPPSRSCRIYFSDGTKLKTPLDVVADLGLQAGMILSDDEYHRLLAATRRASARNRAVAMISAAGHSRAELRRRLVEKGEQEEDAAAAVDWLAELGLLDDRATAQQLVRSAVARGYGRGRIRQILYEKAIPRELWEEALDEIPPMDEAVDRFLQRRFRGADPDEREIKRAVDALLRRGHSYSDIRAGLERYSAGLEMEWEEPI